MQKRFLDLLVLLAACFASTGAVEAVDNKKRFMLEGVATPDVFAALIKSPEDRSVNAAGLMRQAGCELVDYYIGVHNYKTYVVIVFERPICRQFELTTAPGVFQ